MAHQFGVDTQADARWLALTRMIERGADWLDQVLQRWPSPESILGDSEMKSEMKSERESERKSERKSERNSHHADWVALQRAIDNASPNRLLRCLPK